MKDGILFCKFYKGKREKIFNLIDRAKEEKKIRNNCISYRVTKNFENKFFLALSDNKKVKRIFTFALLMHKINIQI